MSIAEDVETLARELGVWHWAHIHENRGRVGLEIHERGGGGYFIRDWLATESGVSSKGVHLTAPEAALFLRCVASGLEVELPCSDCAKRGGSHEWDALAWCGPGVDTWWLKNDETRLVERRGPGWVFGRLVDGPSRTLEHGGLKRMTCVVASRPCPTCSTSANTVVQRDGERWAIAHRGVPTGRETVGLAAAWLRGRDWACASCDGPCPSCEEPGNEDCARCDGTADLGCAECSDGTRATGVIHGDPGTREVLAVLADELQRRGAERVPCDPGDIYAPCCNPDCGGHWGAGCPHCHWWPAHRKCLGRLVDKGGALGELLALDLAGAACPGPCAGTGKIGRHGDRVYPVSADLETKAAHPCRDCEGHGTALAQRLAARIAIGRVAARVCHDVVAGKGAR